MDKRYQVFVSSTYADLKEERQQVIKTLMEMGCIPAGMELFPAVDEEQFRFIKKVIDDCDYYLLIIGGRYGSTTAEGISYTEQEYEYAVSKGLKIVVLIHNNPDAIPYGKSEHDPQLRERLRLFREKVSTNRLVKYWDSAEDLPALVSLNLNKTISEYPAIGWVRANKVASEELLTEINELRKENSNLHQTNEDLQEELAQFNSQPVVENLAGLDEKVKLFGTYTSSYQHQRSSWEITLTWSQIFTFIAPYLPSSPRDRHVKEILEEAAFKMRDIKGYSPDLDDQLFRTIALQLQVLNLVQIKHTHVPAGGTGYWSLTPYGTRLMIQLRTVKKPASDNKDIK